MSESTATQTRGATRASRASVAPRRSRVRLIVVAVLLLLLLIAPLYVDEFWLRTGFAVFGAIVGAIGLNLLVGTTGQLSLAHAFFLAVGAISYTFVSGESGGIGIVKLSGLGWPPLIGITESLAAGYQDQLLFLGRGFSAVIPYIVMIVVLLVRPSGLFGTKELTRV